MPFCRKLKSREFELIFRTGTRINGNLVRILYLKDEKISKTTFGCTTAKRLGKAHVRNRGRRILREAFRQLAKNYEIDPKMKIILSMKEKGINAKTQEIYKELEQLFKCKRLI